MNNGNQGDAMNATIDTAAGHGQAGHDVMSRFDQCDGTCTTSCGHCKGRYSELLADLHLQATGDLDVEKVNGKLLVLEHDEECGGVIYGQAVQDSHWTWYLGCQDCGEEIEQADGGMCGSCRARLAFQESLIDHMIDAGARPL